MKRPAVIAAVLLFCSSAFGGGYDRGYIGKGYTSVGDSIVTVAPVPGPWNGYDYVVVLTADDSYKINRPWSALADSMDFKYTLDLTGSKTGASDTSSYLSIEDMEIIATRPVDVVSTGLTQNLQWGVLRWDETAVNYPDSVALDVDPQWIEDWCGIDFAPDNYVTDVGHDSYDVAIEQRKKGYGGCRAVYHDNPAGGYKPDAPGADRWDKARLFSRTDGGNIYGIASFKGQDDSDETTAIFGTDAEDNQATIDSLSVRLDRLLLNVSDANGDAPICVVLHGGEVTTDMLRQFVIEVRSRKNIWLTDFETLVDFIRADNTVIDAPPYAPLAQLEGIAAGDSIFWGPEPTVYTCTQDSFIFHNSNTTAPVTNKTSVTAGPFTTGLLDPNVPTTAVVTTGNITATVRKMPLAGSYKMGIMGFNIDALDGKTVVDARLHYYQVLGADKSGDPNDYYGVIGVTNEHLLAASGESDMSFNYQDVSTATSWGLPGGTAAGLQNLWEVGPFIYPDNNHEDSGIISQNCTEYVRYAVDNDLDSAMFAMYGYGNDGDILFRFRSHEYSTDTVRPYLVVITCE